MIGCYSAESYMWTHLVRSVCDGLDVDLSPGFLRLLPLVQIVSTHRVSSVIGWGSPTNQHLVSCTVQYSDGWRTGRNVCRDRRSQVTLDLLNRSEWVARLLWCTRAVPMFVWVLDCDFIWSMWCVAVFVHAGKERSDEKMLKVDRLLHLADLTRTAGDSSEYTLFPANPTDFTRNTNCLLVDSPWTVNLTERDVDTRYWEVMLI